MYREALESLAPRRGKEMRLFQHMMAWHQNLILFKARSCDADMKTWHFALLRIEPVMKNLPCMTHRWTSYFSLYQITNY